MSIFEADAAAGGVADDGHAPPRALAVAVTLLLASPRLVAEAVAGTVIANVAAARAAAAVATILLIGVSLSLSWFALCDPGDVNHAANRS